VDGHVGHRWRTRVCGVLCGGTDLDPRLRGDDGGGGREPDGGVGPAFEAVKVDPRLRGDDGREGVWKWAEGDRTGAPGAMGRSWQVRALRFSPRFHHHRPVTSGTGPAVFALPLPPSAGHVRRHPRRGPPRPHHRHPREGGDPGWRPREWTGGRRCGRSCRPSTVDPSMRRSLWGDGPGSPPSRG
jgi:hypothetical protein